MKFLNDSFLLFQRNVKHMLRNPESLIMSIVMPVMLMLLFVFVFGGAVDTGTEYVNFVVPGIIIICVGFGSSLIAVSVCQDMVGGLFERFRSMPLNPSALLIGHVAGSFVRNFISTVVVIIVAVLIGFRPNASFFDWLMAFGILSLFLLTISWLSVILGLLAKNVETASAFTFIFMFLPYISSAFVPTETMPDWLHPFANNQPITPLIETLRGLLTGTPIENNGVISILWFGSLLVIFYIVAVIIFNRRREV